MPTSFLVIEFMEASCDAALASGVTPSDSPPKDHDVVTRFILEGHGQALDWGCFYGGASQLHEYDTSQCSVPDPPHQYFYLILEFRTLVGLPDRVLTLFAVRAVAPRA